jgi:hypothetical protein
MKKVRLAVTPLVASILTTRYGNPVIVHRSDALYTHLQGSPVNVSSRKFKKLNRELTKEITVVVSNSIADHITANHRQAKLGLFLHKVYQEEMVNYMHAQNKCGTPAQTALKDFLKSNGVTEDDYALDTAYTVWKRKKQFFSKKTVGSILENDLHEEGENDSLVPVDFREILLAVNHYYSCGMANIICRDIVVRAKNRCFTYCYDDAMDFQYRKCRKVAAYLLHTDGQMRGTQIAEIIHLHARSIQRYIKKTRFFMDFYGDFQHDVEQIRKLYSV